MLGAPGSHRWWIAPVAAQARIAFTRLRRGVPPSVVEANETRLTLTFGNGAMLAFKSGEDPDNLYGEDVADAVVDEASRLREEAWHAVRTTLTATHGHARLIGNVHGRRNWFYRMARRAEAGEPDMAYHKLIAADAIEAGVLTEAEVQDARRQLPERVFRELYLAEPSDDEGNPFGGSVAIRGCLAPLSSAPTIAWGVDLAKSVDWTVAIGMDAHGQVTRIERFQVPWRETIGRLGLLLGDTRSLIDSTGVGDPIVETLQRQARAIEGFKFTAQSKQQLMEGLAVAIQRREVGFPEGPIVAELEAFEYQATRTGVRYAAPEGMHDDCVCALALAWQAARRPVSVPRLVRL